jgi:hypothetical protein
MREVNAAVPDPIESDPGPIESPWPFDEQEPEGAALATPEPLEPPSEDERRFVGLSHEEALAREVPPIRQLVARVVEAGTLGTIAGLPETGKSLLATAITYKVAAGGTVLGELEVFERGPVGYWWQDDSEANELARLQEYAHRHGYTGTLPIRWHLNEGLILPADIPALRAEIEREGQLLAVLDSAYNFLPGISLKEEEVAAIFAQVKADVCDKTGCAVLVVDHAPWPNEGNRGQRRGYGSVFKAAAIRWGIYLERTGDGLFIEARGNNLAGLKRRRCYIDESALELRLLDDEHVADEKIEARIVDYVEKNPGASKSQVESKVTGGAPRIRAAIERMAVDERLRLVPGTGRAWNARYVFPTSDAGLTLVPEGRTSVDEPAPEAERSSPRPLPVGGTSVSWTSVDDGELEAEAERILAKHADAEGHLRRD